MSGTRSCLYTGVVSHRRFVPKPHALRYRMFMALLDIDELDALGQRLRLFSRNRFNLFSFHDGDHLPKHAPAGRTLRATVEQTLDGLGLAPDGGAIRLLSLPRILGFAFNPLSVYFCYRPDGTLKATLYEVNNTFGERHTYAIPVEAGAQAVITQRCGKAFYVSPFLDMDMTYDFRVVAPCERVSVAVDGSKAAARTLAASFAGERVPLTDGRLLKAFLAYPLMNVMVVAGIHWEALKLWIKGIGPRTRPAPPQNPVSLVPRRDV